MADAVRRVDIGSLDLGPVLGSGGQGQVRAVSNYRIDDKWPAVLKTYNGSVNLDVRGLEKIAAFPDRLHRNDRDWLLGVSAWPWAIAMDGGTVRGFLMRAVPDIYRFNFMTVTQGSKAMLSTVEFLLNTDDYVSRSGISISEQGRLNLLGTLADAMSRLHALGIVIGDVSPKNLLFNLSSYVSCFFIDCDAIRLHGECALEQIDTPEWEVPPGEEKGTEGSDSYKFGLLAIRLFARDQSSRDGAALSALSAELGALAGRSQDRDPAGRPAPGSWVSAIQSAASAASSANATQTSPQQPNSRFTAGGQHYQPFRIPQPQNQSGAGTQPQAAPPRRRGKSVRALFLSGLALTVLVAVIIAANLSGHSHTGSFSSSASSGGSGSGAPNSQAAPSAQPTNVGVVGISGDVSGDSATPAVAAIFNTYFTGINGRNYQQAASVFDPSGIIDPDNSTQVQQFTQGVSTTKDSSIMLVDIEPSDGSTAQTAELQFTSNQQAGYGPKEDPSETCTDWDVTYGLAQDSSDNYLIHSVSNSRDSAC